MFGENPHRPEKIIKKQEDVTPTVNHNPTMLKTMLMNIQKKNTDG